MTPKQQVIANLIDEKLAGFAGTPAATPDDERERMVLLRSLFKNLQAEGVQVTEAPVEPSQAELNAAP